MPTAGQTWPPTSKAVADRLEALAANTYTKAQVDAKAGGKIAAYSPTTNYGAGEPAVFAGDLYTAKAAIMPGTPVAYVGRTFDASGTSIALPAGAAAGDLALLTHSNRDTEAPAVPSGWTRVAGTPLYSSGRAGVHAFHRVLTAADITAGTVSKAASQGDVRVYRGAGTPTVQGSSTSNTPPGFAVPAGAFALRTFAYGWYTGNEIAGPPSIGTNVADAGSYYVSSGYARGVASAHLTGRPVANGDGAGTPPSGGGTLAIVVDLVIAPASGFQAAQWSRLTDSASRVAALEAVGPNPFPVLHRWNLAETTGTALADSGAAPAPLTAYGGVALNVESVGAGSSKAVALDGVDDYLATALGAAGVDDIKGYGYVLSFWYKPASMSVSDAVIASHGDGTAAVSKGWFLAMGSTSVVALTVYGVGGKMTVGNGTHGLSTSAFRRVSLYIPPAGVAGTPAFFSNGVAVASGDANTVIAAAAGPVTFGAYYRSGTTPDLYRAGRYSDIRITKAPDATAAPWIAKNDYDRALLGQA